MSQLASKPGVIGVVTVKKSYYRADEVMELLGIKEAKAYTIMKSTRMEMIEKKLLSKDYPVGRVPKRYFNQKYGIEED